MINKNYPDNTEVTSIRWDGLNDMEVGEFLEGSKWGLGDTYVQITSLKVLKSLMRANG